LCEICYNKDKILLEKSNIALLDYFHAYEKVLTFEIYHTKIDWASWDCEVKIELI